MKIIVLKANKVNQTSKQIKRKALRKTTHQKKNDSPQKNVVRQVKTRQLRKLSPFVAYHLKVLDDFLERFWKYYRSHAVRGLKLLAYRSDALRQRDSPTRDKAYVRTQCAVELELEFWTLFTEKKVRL